MRSTFTAQGIISRLMMANGLGLFITYSLLLLESISIVLQPFFLGKLVDLLVKDNWWGILYLTGLYFFQMIVGTVRRAYDTRFYSRIYVDLSTKIINKHNSLNELTSKIVAHANLSREFINFLEQDIAILIRGVVNSTGAVFMLGTYSWEVMTLCLLALIPIYFSNRYYEHKVHVLYIVQNTDIEHQIDVIAKRNAGPILSFYQKLRRNQIHISDQGALNFGIIQLLVLIVFGLALVVYVKAYGPVTAGNIIAIATYLGSFFMELLIFPIIIERVAKLKDIAVRIAEVLQEGNPSEGLPSFREESDAIDFTLRKAENSNLI